MLWKKIRNYRFFKSRRIYLDYAAATPLDIRVLRVMNHCARNVFGNPSSVHREGVCAKEEVNNARRQTARTLRVREEEIIFTSGGTESNNLAIFGVVESLRNGGRDYSDMHIITSVAEHVSVLKPIKFLESKGVLVTYLGIDKYGRILPEKVVEALRPSTVLISLMYVNNEIGTLTPLRKIASSVREYYNKKTNGASAKYPIFHTDASQAPLFLDCSPEHIGVDLLTLDSQKLYGPKGVGLLYKKHNLLLSPFLLGGGQEGGMRPGTESVSNIVGFAEALACAEREHNVVCKRVSKLRDFFILRIEEMIPRVILNGDREQRIANNVNISIPECDMEFLVIKLDHAGIATSSASACLAEVGSSYVIGALQKDVDQNIKAEAIRFTLGRETTKRDINMAISALRRCVDAC